MSDRLIVRCPRCGTGNVVTFREIAGNPRRHLYDFRIKGCVGCARWLTEHDVRYGSRVHGRYQAPARWGYRMGKGNHLRLVDQTGPQDNSRPARNRRRREAKRAARQDRRKNGVPVVHHPHFWTYR